MPAHFRFLLSFSLHCTSADAVQSHRRLVFARGRWDWYMYDAHLQRTLACGWKANPLIFPQKKRKVAFPRWNILKIEMLEGQKHGKKSRISFTTFEKFIYTSGISFFGMDYRKDPSLFFRAHDPDHSRGFWLKLQWKKFGRRATSKAKPPVTDMGWKSSTGGTETRRSMSPHGMETNWRNRTAGCLQERK